MLFPVTWLTVILLLILPEKDTTIAQNTDLANEESRAWRRSDILSPELPTNMQPPEEWNNQEPLRRRRRKRKRRPQQPEQSQQFGDNDRTNYWQHGEVDDDEQENGGIMVTVNGVKGIQNINTEVWHDENDRSRVQYPNKNEFVQGIVMQVAGPDDNANNGDATNKSYRKPYVVPKKDDGSNGENAANDLKKLLKNSGGLSLSEILQKQNLSLDDLLKGKQNAFKALQNTAAPSTAENLSAKGVRRIPGVKRPLAVSDEQDVNEKPVQSITSDLAKNDDKQTRRLPNFSRPKVDATVATSVTQEQNKQLAGTKSNHMIPSSPVDNSNTATSAKPNIYETVTTASPNIRGLLGNRRLPASNGNERTKPIKEVVSRIRPDLSNSNSRRRLLPIKLRTNNTTTPANTPKERLPPRFSNAPKVGATEISNKTQVNDELPINVPTESSTIDIEVIPSISTTFVTPSMTTTNSPITPEKAGVKDIVKTRLALKPRLRLPHLSPNPTSTTTNTETPTEVNDVDPTDIISSEEFPSSESSDEVELTTLPNEESLTEDEENKFMFSSDEELKEILDKSEPQINSILEEFALFNGRKNIVPIEDLFEDSVGVDNENLQTFTSRSDTMSVTDKTNQIHGHLQNSYHPENSKMSNSKVDVTERNPSLFSDITSSRTADDKTEILELLDDSRKYLPLGSSYFTSIINIKPTDEIYKEGRSLKQDVFMQPLPPADRHPHWKNKNYPSQDVNYIDSAKLDVISLSRLSPFDDEIDQIENELARSHDFVDLELSGHGFKPNSVSIETASIPVGVPSAIIASASIVGICLMIFILIFVTCRWRQKRKKKLNYSENFQTVRGRLPTLTRNSTSSSSTKRSSSPNVFTTMNSRSSKLNTMDPNSPEVQEYLYDAMRKSFR